METITDITRDRNNIVSIKAVIEFIEQDPGEVIVTEVEIQNSEELQRQLNELEEDK